MHLKGIVDLSPFLFFLVIYLFIYSYVHALFGQFLFPAPTPSFTPSLSPSTLSLPGRTCFALFSNFVEEKT
jgi:hypothetical protein